MLVPKLDQAEQNTHLCFQRFADGAGSAAPVTAQWPCSNPVWCGAAGTRGAAGVAVHGGTIGRMAWAGSEGRGRPNLQPDPSTTQKHAGWLWEPGHCAPSAPG